MDGVLLQLLEQTRAVVLNLPKAASSCCGDLNEKIIADAKFNVNSLTSELPKGS